MIIRQVIQEARKTTQEMGLVKVVNERRNWLFIKPPLSNQITCQNIHVFRVSGLFCSGAAD